MIRISDKKVELAYLGSKVITRIYYGLNKVYQSIIGCFSQGFWINKERWTNNQGWKNN